MASASLTKLLGLKLTVNQLKNLCIAKSSGIIQTLGATSLVTVIHSVHRCPQRAKKEQKKQGIAWCLPHMGAVSTVFLVGRKRTCRSPPLPGYSSASLFIVYMDIT